ncbi:MAG TPA: histone deacetylase family protein [Acidimicrobiia bacterium]|nr:histone deacetylase family protein [Acidimicrobiia bacterium]
MTVVAVWSDEALAHDPGGEVWIGLPIEGDETSDRALAMLRAIEAAGVDVVAPQAHPDSAITAVHDPGMLDYLATAHDRWVEAGYPGHHGQHHVVAYAFRHPGAFDHVPRRHPRSRAAMAGVYCFDTCTTIGPGTYRGIRYAADAALTAADLMLEGKTAYAAVRPPGHHAGTDYFGGSCYLNNTAIAAHYVAEATRARVGIIDIDAHHGNGTQEIFYGRGDVLYASVHIDPAQGWFPHWSGFADETGSGPGAGLNHNLVLAPGDGDDEYVAAVERAAEAVVGADCEVLVVSLGVDSSAEDENSPLEVTSEGFLRAADLLTALGVPMVLMQEGGYNLEALERDLTTILSRLSVERAVDER